MRARQTPECVAFRVIPEAIFWQRMAGSWKDFLLVTGPMMHWMWMLLATVLTWQARKSLSAVERLRSLWWWAHTTATVGGCFFPGRNIPDCQLRPRNGKTRGRPRVRVPLT